eukprot:tig00020629_g12379.t1
MDKKGCKVTARFGRDAKFESLGVLYDNYNVDGAADIVVAFAEFKFDRSSSSYSFAPSELWFGYYSDVMGLTEYEEKRKRLPEGFVTKSLIMKTPDAYTHLHASVPLENATNCNRTVLNGIGSPVKLPMTLKANPFAVVRGASCSKASFPAGPADRSREVNGTKRKAGVKYNLRPRKQKKPKSENEKLEEEFESEEDLEEADEDE